MTKKKVPISSGLKWKTVQWKPFDGQIIADCGKK